MRTPWLKAAVILCGLWLVVAGVIFWVRSVKPSPTSVVRYATEHPLAGKSADERDKIMRHVAEELSALNYDERRDVRLSRKLDPFYNALTKDEQGTFIDLTFPAGFKEMMNSFNNMTPQRRQRFVEHALNDLRQHADMDGDLGPDDANRQKIVDQGLQAFYTDATAETKRDLAPLVEQMQRNLQGF